MKKAAAKLMFLCVFLISNICWTFADTGVNQVTALSGTPGQPLPRPSPSPGPSAPDGGAPPACWPGTGCTSLH